MNKYISKRYVEIENASKNLRLRPLNSLDLNDTLLWRNRDDVRCWFKNSDIISFEQHQSWFKSYLFKIDDITFILEFKDQSIGQLAVYNIDFLNKKAEIGRFIVNPAFKNKGFMKAGIEMLIELCRTKLNLNELELEVFVNNENAIHIYRKLGFIDVSISDSKLLKMHMLLLKPSESEPQKLSIDFNDFKSKLKNKIKSKLLTKVNNETLIEKNIVSVNMVNGFQLQDYAIERLKAFAPFDPSCYIENNPDLKEAGVEPYEHYINSGFKEARTIFDQIGIAKHIGRACEIISLKTSNSTSSSTIINNIDFKGSIAVVATSIFNPFLDSIVDDLVISLKKTGADVIRLSDKDMPNLDHDYRIIVQPDWLVLQHNKYNWCTTEIIKKSFVLSYEQLQTWWFSFGIPFFLSSKGIIEMFSYSSHLFSECGVPSIHFVPNPKIGLFDNDYDVSNHEFIFSLPKEVKNTPNVQNKLSDRIIDVCYFGSENTKRDQTLIRCSELLPKAQLFFCSRRLITWFKSEDKDNSLVKFASYIAGHSKITLNIHRDYFGSFEWFRIVKIGMCSGSLIVTDKCYSSGSFIAGKHYVHVDNKHLPEMLEWLIYDRDGIEYAQQIRDNALELLKYEFENNIAGKQIIEFLDTCK